ncbi:UDP-N-acetylenolpyruvoylglucosamine reductase [Microbacterium sp. 1.5R]|uniref:UDP-N-acetylmuramate dehydrogenase n=1 Tax=unclassified Microbacterium TaxID=2609290 RepID=UPI00069D3F2C|nr:MULTISPECIES: UDP-N-acetylmuramate dehydrogenase [unclassified Microbacterium]AKV86318.1 UDP-N-acetylenolpyruvoylglucosamine reductase [Microbacterium sp. CGR1]APH45760.1 UDP-N-acetylenolpyruvoylglucosamine reductase [Microbacterium sp. 1.5R]MBC6495923.1 UDP-N-acetylenolpyruvoylglucosamine reductase [Microbacterium sp. 4-7]MDY0984743.1 UDP-N-acetylmuramate dehydrogenase [Microbacterium sp. CFBP9023]
MHEVEPLRLATLTTLRTGGAPERMLEASTTAELIDALTDVWSRGDEWFVLGGGSNLFIGDESFEGTVIRVLTRGIEELPSPHAGRIRLRVQAGHGWDDLVAYAVEHGYAGLEAMSGIPGTVGASPVQNIGAYGQEIQETLVEVELIDEATGEVSVVPASELGLGFRTSVLKHHYGSVPQRRAVILSVTVDLLVADERVVRGEQLRRALGLDSDAPVPLTWVRERILATRASKGMLLDENDPDTHGVGSFFQNAIVPEVVARALPPECPRWPVTPDLDTVTVIPLASYDGYVPPAKPEAPDVKVSAAWLIEQAGIRKGFKLPRSRASVSTKHALALTNRGGATAAEVSELARFIQSRVHSEFGLVLQPEPVLLGVEL